MGHFQRRLLAVAVLLSSPYLVMACWLTSHRGLLSGAGYLVVAVAGLLLLAVPVRRARHFLLLHFPVFLLCSVISVYTVVFGQLPGDAVAFVLESSSWEEVRGFLGLWQGQRLLLLLLGASCTYLLLSSSIPSSTLLSVGGARIRRAIIGCLALSVACAALGPEQLMEGVSASPVLGTAMFLNGPLSSANIRIHGPVDRKRPYGAVNVGREEVHILVIGESSRRDSWSVYGYSRPTTPYLASIQSEVVFFRNALSDANATVFAVPIMLTGIKPQAFTFAASTGNIVDLAREAGYFAVWLVNQDPSPSQLVGIESDASRYPPPLRRPAYVIYPPDAVLLPEFERQVARTGRPLFIGMHVYGSHAPYSSRFPPSFARFGARPRATLAAAPGVGTSDQELVDSYDNSILYTDWFLGRVIERARKLDVPATVTYLSDHGEDLQPLDGRSGHGAGDYSPHAFEVPAFVWMNEAYRHEHPEKAAALAANASKEVRSHDFFYLLADLMGVRWPGASPQRSFASPDFVPDTAEKFIAGGTLVPRAE